MLRIPPNSSGEVWKVQSQHGWPTSNGCPVGLLRRHESRKTGYFQVAADELTPIQQEGEEAECAIQRDCKSGWMRGTKSKTIPRPHSCWRSNGSICSNDECGEFASEVWTENSFNTLKKKEFFQSTKLFLRNWSSGAVADASAGGRKNVLERAKVQPVPCPHAGLSSQGPLSQRPRCLPRLRLLPPASLDPITFSSFSNSTYH